MVNIQREFQQIRTDSASLTATGVLMLGALVAFTAGIVLDPRTVTGAPAWLKPAKFALSTATFAFTTAWLLRYLTVWRPFLRVMAAGMSGLLILEVGIIAFQAARGVPSHFNAASQFDAVLFAIMGVAILLLWLLLIGLFAALLRQRFENPAWGWWLRLGVLLSVIGSGSGGAMVRMTSEQVAARRTGEGITAVGGHTVGAPDGGPGIPLTGWSREHGDLRIPHFIGLHGMQILPLLGWLVMRRGGRTATQTRLAFVGAGSYLSLLIILWWQALRGQSVLAPDEVTLVALASWLMATGAAVCVGSGACLMNTMTAGRKNA